MLCTYTQISCTLLHCEMLPNVQGSAQAAVLPATFTTSESQAPQHCCAVGALRRHAWMGDHLRGGRCFAAAVGIAAACMPPAGTPAATSCSPSSTTSPAGHRRVGESGQAGFWGQCHQTCGGLAAGPTHPYPSLSFQRHTHPTPPATRRLTRAWRTAAHGLAPRAAGTSSRRCLRGRHE